MWLLWLIKVFETSFYLDSSKYSLGEGNLPLLLAEPIKSSILLTNEGLVD